MKLTVNTPYTIHTVNVHILPMAILRKSTASKPEALCNITVVVMLDQCADGSTALKQHWIYVLYVLGEFKTLYFVCV